MGIPILSEIERLINEHGSASILKERLALASDQYGALEKKLSETNLRNEQLQSENASLRLDLEKAQEKIRNLEEKLVERHGQRLEEIREEFLQLLVTHSDITSQQIASAIGKSAELATFHLTEMENAQLVHGSYYAGGETEWSIAHGGRAYLDRKSTRLNSSHSAKSRMPSSA